MPRMVIADLGDHPAHLPTLARWHFDQWGPLTGTPSLDAYVEALTMAATSRTVPSVLIAMEGARLLGSVSLLAADLPPRAHLTPWLAQLFVDPAERRGGVGAALVGAAVDRARACGYARVYLFTSGTLPEYYRRLGWREIERLVYLDRERTVMDRDVMSTTGAIKAVVFDMDGVLCRYRIDRRLALLSSWSGRTPEAIRAAIWESGFEDEGERGLLSADDYLAGVRDRLGYPLSAAQWVEARRAAIEPDLAVLSLARQIGKTYPVGMFTNNPLLLKRHFAEVFPLAAEILGPRAVFSSELGRTKPDPEAFRLLAARIGFAPAEVLYFDDDAKYVVGAREAGLSAHRAVGADDVRAALAIHDIRCV